MLFGDRLRTLIEEWDISQKQLATEMNIAPSTLGSYVQNAREPDFDTLKMFAEYFHVSADYLLGLHTENTSTHNENEMLRIFRSLSEEQQELYLEQGKAFVRINHRRNH